MKDSGKYTVLFALRRSWSFSARRRRGHESQTSSGGCARHFTSSPTQRAAHPVAGCSHPGRRCPHRAARCPHPFPGCPLPKTGCPHPQKRCAHLPSGWAHPLLSRPHLCIRGAHLFKRCPAFPVSKATFPANPPSQPISLSLSDHSQPISQTLDPKT